MPRFIFILVFLTMSNIGLSQTFVKGNLTTIIGYPNLGIEIGLGYKTTFQIDVFASIWKSINKGPHEILMLFPELRYYPKKNNEGFYTGVHIGGAKYKLKKLNYFNTDSYQDGYSVLYGISIGYQLKINNRINFDIYIGGGNQQGFYKGYDSSGNRYEKVKNYNKSGEWLLYRGGIMFAYKL